MSGLALIADPEAEAGAIGSVDGVLELLSHRGPDGRRSTSGDWFSVGHLHHWTTPEEIGERQPLRDSEAGITLALCGRVDNRQDLIGPLELPPSASDAALLLAAYRRWGERAFARILGPFALVVVDERRRRIVCARDPVGDRGLYWSLAAGRLVVASEEVGTLSLRSRETPRLDLDQLARLFAVTDLIPGRTFVVGVREVEPGTALVFDRGEPTVHRFWEPPPWRAPRERTDEEWEEAFRETLERAVAARLRTPLRPAVLMSGGLDSTSVAALAARQRAEPLLASSWVFDELAAADERRAMVPAAEHLGLDWEPLVSDSLWPLRQPDDWPSHPNGPLEGMFRWPRLHSYRDLHARGAGLLLTGENGDHFFTRRDHWLRSTLRARRLGLATRGVAALVRDRTPWGPSVSLRSSVGRAIGWRPRWRGWPSRLTEEARDRLPAGGPAGSAHERSWRRVLDSWSQRGFCWESRHAALEGLEIRRPFRDRRLLELAMSVPAHQLHRPPWPKSLLRRSMRGLLPPAVTERAWLTSLSALARRGIDEREAGTVDRLLRSETAAWRHCVRAEWLMPEGRRIRLTEGHDGALVWACFTLEQWRQLLSLPDRWRGRAATLPSISSTDGDSAGREALGESRA